MIFRLARLQISSHRLRTTFAAVAVVLTAVLYMTVISIAYCFMDSIQLSKMLAFTSDVHACVWDTGYSISGEELRREIQNAPEVSETFIASFAPVYWEEPAEANSLDQWFGVAFVDREKVLSHLFMTITEGWFPRSEEEILLCRESFPTLSVGDQVSFHLDNPATGEPLERTCTVSGFYRSDADRPPPAVALYGEDIAEGLDLSVMVNFHSSFGIDQRLDAVMERLSQWEIPGEEHRTQINLAYVAADLGSFFQPGNVLLILLAVGVLFFAAFLLIYNIYSIALAQDMRSFGLLKVIGMTHRQMKKLTFIQTGLIACVALPVGLLAGYFIGFQLLSPVFMSMSGDVLPYRFSPWIAFISAGLTLFTLFFSALRPLGKIRKLTPVQSVSGSQETAAPKKEKRREAPATPGRLALAGLNRSRGRMLVTSLSAGLSVLLFVMVGGFADVMVEGTVARFGMYDVELTLSSPLTTGIVPPEYVSASKFAAVEPEAVEILAGSEAVRDMYMLHFAPIDATLPSGTEENIRAFLAQQENDWARDELHSILDSGLLRSVILGIPDELCQNIMVSNDAGDVVPYPGEELYDGSHILCVSFADDADSLEGARIFSGDRLTSDNLSREYMVIDVDVPSGIWGALRQICSQPVANSVGADENIFLLPESVFKKEFPDAPVFAILANAKEDKQDALREEVGAWAEERTVERDSIAYSYLARGKLFELEDLRERLAAIQLTGYSLCGIIFLIGLMNMVNSALTSTVQRRREFAMLETVGMTRAQLRLMLVYENSVGGVFGLAAFVVGSALSNALLAQIFNVKVSAISLPAVGILLLLFVIGGVTAELSYRLVTKASLTERVKGEE